MSVEMIGHIWISKIVDWFELNGMYSNGSNHSNALNRLNASESPKIQIDLNWMEYIEMVRTVWMHWID